ncbi:SAM-dependent methyltransferase [Verrucomicrobiaceae bacterium SCGC AG-212-N21]|nr:SAM-dependent methyltransferase [Verrucomicrobiaceae bacterium SCGC AG-212-N21]
MSNPSVPNEPLVAFGPQHAAVYDKQFAKLAPMRDALHFLTGVLLSELPANARILSVGAGTGADLIHLAQQYPQWHFTAVEPSPAMLDVCRRRTEELGIASRCVFHEGYLETLPPSEPFDAATSILVSQFILAPESRTAFFRAIAQRLRPGGCLISADLAADLASPSGQRLLDVWLHLMKFADIPPDKLEQMRAVYGRDVAVLPAEQITAMIAAGGFETPTLLLQTGLIHAWLARFA